MAAPRQELGVAGVKRVRHRIGEIARALAPGPSGGTVGRTNVIARALAVVDTQGEQHRDAVADAAEVIPLRCVVPRRRIAIGVLVGHEQVAEVEVEIGAVGADIRQCALVNSGTGVLVEVRVGGEREGERGAGRAGGVEGARGGVRERGSGLGVDGARPKFVLVTVVGAKAGHFNFRGAARGETAHGAAAGVGGSIGAPRGITFQGSRGLDAQCHGAGFGPGQQEVERLGGKREVEVVGAARAAVVPATTRTAPSAGRRGSLPPGRPIRHAEGQQQNRPAKHTSFKHDHLPVLPCSGAQFRRIFGPRFRPGAGRIAHIQRWLRPAPR